MNANKLTKPRLYLWRSLWYCSNGSGKAGLGYTKPAAYADWLERNSEVTK